MWRSPSPNLPRTRARTLLRTGNVEKFFQKSKIRYGVKTASLKAILFELEKRIGELEEYVNDPIIVYCKAGSRSQVACEILATHGFTKVHNMLGGIIAWIEAGYPIYTTYHHVTVNVEGKHVITQIEPLLLYQTGCMSCGCQLCAQDQTYQNNNTPSNVTVTTVEQDENHKETLVTYKVNDITYEATITQTLLWSHRKENAKANITAKFISTEITAEDISLQFYSLSYKVRHEEYNLTLLTTLTLLDSETYNSSFTIVNCAPAGKSELTSLELVKFSSSVTLSQQYAILGKVAKEVSEAYKKSEDETFKQLAKGYRIIEKEAEDLSKIVEKQLQDYDKEILESRAIFIDSECSVAASTICSAVITGMGAIACIWIASPCGMWYPVCYAACLVAWAAASGAFCTWLGNTLCGEETTVKQLGCGAACEVICLGCPGGNIACIMCSPLCEQVCEQIF